MDDKVTSDHVPSAAERRDIGEKMIELVNHFQASIAAGKPDYGLIQERIAIAHEAYSHLIVPKLKLQK